jgi:hypothetical protein
MYVLVLVVSLLGSGFAASTSAAVTTMRVGVFSTYQACQSAAKESKVEYEFGDQKAGAHLQLLCLKIHSPAV